MLILLIVIVLAALLFSTKPKTREERADEYRRERERRFKERELRNKFRKRIRTEKEIQAEVEQFTRIRKAALKAEHERNERREGAKAFDEFCEAIFSKK